VSTGWGRGVVGKACEGGARERPSLPLRHQQLISEIQPDLRGEVREWLNRAVSKTVEPPGSEGSNPSLSAIVEHLDSGLCTEDWVRQRHGGDAVAERSERRGYPSLSAMSPCNSS
jgi:hypothetical protein